MTTIAKAVSDPRLFGPWFKDRTTWEAWFAFLGALFGTGMTADQVTIFRECTGRTAAPIKPTAEAWLICGRRAGKSFVLALVAVFLGCFRSYAEHLAPGERAMVLVIATDRRQARVIFRYIRGFLTTIPMLRKMIEREASDGFDLINFVSIEVATASYRTVRGYAIAAALCDEIAFWPTDDSAEPDYAILDAIRPGMATIPSAMVLCASSPYARRGALWDAWRKHYGRDGDVLVWKAPTRRMNPTVPQAVIDRAAERDPASAAAEFGAEFRNDIAAFVSREAVEACVSAGVFERPPIAGVTYRGFTDPSGGSVDSMTLGVAHMEGDAAILDCLREVRAPFRPDDVVAEFAAMLKSYRVKSVTGDRYGGEWPRDAFRKHGVEYRPAEMTKSAIFLGALPAINSGRVDLLDNPRLIAQLCGLERRTARGGRDTIDHAPGSHDDLANAAAGALSLCQRRIMFEPDLGGPPIQVEADPLPPDWLNAFYY